MLRQDKDVGYHSDGSQGSFKFFPSSKLAGQDLPGEKRGLPLVREEEEERKSESEEDLQETTIQQMIRALEEDDVPPP